MTIITSITNGSMRMGLRSSNCVISRSIHLNVGARVRGAKRDPASYLKTGKHIYGDSTENLATIQEFLKSSDSQKYALSNDVILQVITHKSFAHAQRPYNERLAFLGTQLLKQYTSLYTISQTNSNSLGINGLNFDVLGTSVSKFLSVQKTVAEFAVQHKLNEVLFFKSANPLSSDIKETGEYNAAATTAYALVGAVLLTHGKKVAEEFIQEKLLNGDHSIVNIAKQLVEEQQAIIRNYRFA